MELVGDIKNFLEVENNLNLATHYDFNEHIYYRVVKERYTEFWKCICETINKDSNSSGSYSHSELSESETDSESEYDLDHDNTQVSSPLQLAEVIYSNQNIPLILDFKIKFEAGVVENALNIYDNNFIAAIVRECQAEIKNNYNISFERDELVCCLIEYPERIFENEYLVHFKLHFPNLKVNPNDRIYTDLIKRLSNTSLLTQLKYHPKYEWSKIITALNKQYIPIFGQETHKPRFTCAFIEDAKIEKQIDKLFDPKKHNHYVQQYFNPGSDILKTSFWSPMFFSIEYGIKHAKRLNNRNRDGTAGNLQYQASSNDTDDQALAKKFLMMINRERANIEYYWLDIGKAIYNVFDGSKRGLKIWIKFTRKFSEKFNRGDCERVYEDFEVENNITLRTLGWYARQDSKVMYEDWMKQRIKKSISDVIREYTDFNVGVAFQKMFWLDYVCASIEKKEWYKYEPRHHHWVKIDGGCDIRNEISTTFSSQFRIYRQEFMQAIDEAANQAQRDRNDILKKNITKAIMDAGNYSKKNILVKQIADLMIDKNFSEIKDINTKIFGIKNGVIECFEDQAVFRSGKPEDYITRSSFVRYDPKMSWKHPNVRKVKHWFRKLYPGMDLYNYVWKIYASFLEGRNLDKKLYFFTGTTNGGKSMLKKFFESILCKYSFTLSASALASRNGKGGNSGLRPDLAQAINCNTAWVLESNETMSETEVKMWTGNDAVFVRLMGENGGNQTPRFKLLYVCNMVPIVIAGDEAMRERILPIPHSSIFSHNPPKSKDEQFEQRVFKRDNNFEKKLLRLRAAGLWMMVQFFKKYKKEGLKMPAEIKASTEDYWNNNDIYGCFMAEFIEETESDKVLFVSELYTTFCDWLRDNYPSIENNLPNKNVVKTIFDQRFKNKKMSQLQSNCWRGIAIKNNRRSFH